MRVALIDPSLFTLPYDRALAGGLARAGHRVTLYGRQPGPEDGDPADLNLIPDFYKVAGTRTLTALPKPLRLGVKGVDHMVSMLRVLRRLRASRPDVIHFQWLPLPVVDGRMLERFAAVAPLVLTVHDTNPFNGAPSAGVQQRGFFTCLGAFSRVIVHTAQGRARLRAQGVPEERLLVIPHGLLTGAVPSPSPDPMQGPLTLVLFGKIKPYKGVDVLIEAFARLPDALRAQARIHVIGKPYMDLAPLRDLARSRGILDQLTIEPRFVADAEVAHLFARGTVAVFPYREIEASGVLSLALAHGRPVIASNLGNFAEWIEDGVQGRLVPPGDVAALTSALASMIGDRDFASACSMSAHRLATRIADWDEIGRLTSAAYAGAAAEAWTRSSSQPPAAMMTRVSEPVGHG